MYGKYLDRSIFLTHGQLCTGLNKGFLRLNNSTIQLASQSSIDILNGNITTINSEISSLKSSVSNGKSLIAAAVTDKGVPTAASDSFTTMSNNIRNIELGYNPIINIGSLPAGYTKCNYIETDGNAYINTLYNANSDFNGISKCAKFIYRFSINLDDAKVQLHFSQQVKDITYYYIFGSNKMYCYLNNQTNGLFYNPINNSNKSLYLYFVPCSNTNPIQSAHIFDNRIHTLECCNSCLHYVNDVKKYGILVGLDGNFSYNMGNDTSLTTANPIYLGRVIGDFSIMKGSPIKNKIYGFYVEHTISYTDETDYINEPCINMIPCINPSGEVGMYDTIRQQFFGNANSEGSFTYG